MRLLYKSRCVPELQEMSKAPKHTTFRFWYPNYLIWQPAPGGDQGRSGEIRGDRSEIKWRFRGAKAE